MVRVVYDSIFQWFQQPYYKTFKNINFKLDHRKPLFRSCCYSMSTLCLSDCVLRVDSSVRLLVKCYF